MAHGGSNFGFHSGANDHPNIELTQGNPMFANDHTHYLPYITSYDYSAPISEAGDHNIGNDGGDLYSAVQRGLLGDFSVSA